MAFIFFDVETSGLDPSQDITELGAIYIDSNYTPNLKKFFHRRLILQNPDLADEEALEIGHYNEVMWEKTAVPAEQGLLEFNDWLKEMCPSEKPTMIAQNAEFDKSFLYSNSDRFTVCPYIENSWLDLIAPWLMYKDIKKLNHLMNSQKAITKHFGIKNAKAHAALTDAAAGAQCFEKLMKMVEFKDK